MWKRRSCLGNGKLNALKIVNCNKTVCVLLQSLSVAGSDMVNETKVLLVSVVAFVDVEIWLNIASD